jgi:hypothetical protein
MISDVNAWEGREIIPTRTDETRSRSDSYKTSDSARAKSDCRPLFLNAIVLKYIDEINIMSDGLRGAVSFTQSIQVNPPTLAAKLVTMQADAARKFAARADPPLKPVH